METRPICPEERKKKYKERRKRGREYSRNTEEERK
jgi:hypothetical protein